MTTKKNGRNNLPGELDLDFLKEITDGFSDERKLRTGSFGTVYKGIRKDGKVIAVKKLEKNSPLGRDKEFDTKVRGIMELKHRNIVEMVGFCRKAGKNVVLMDGRYVDENFVETLLCYEYSPKGSLTKYIYGHDTFGWTNRFKIVKGICHGLLFLHKFKVPIIHMDLKPENILLNDEMLPQIADFGLARLFGQAETRILTKNVMGSYGYIAPEYWYDGIVSLEADIYSLGILIMEITTGEKNPSNENDLPAIQYIAKVQRSWTDEHIASKYKNLDNVGVDEVKTCIKIGVECVQLERKDRPPIEEIVQRLDGQYAN